MNRCRIGYKFMFVAVDFAVLMVWMLLLTGVASVVLRAVSELVRYGVAADILTAAAVAAACHYADSFVMVSAVHPFLYRVDIILVVLFAVLGWRFPLRLCRKAFCGRKSRRSRRVKYYLTASLLRAPWVLWVLLIAVQFLLVHVMDREALPTLVALLRLGKLFVLLPVILCLVRLYRKHQTEAARRCLIISAVVLLFLFR